MYLLSSLEVVVVVIVGIVQALFCAVIFGTK